MEQNLKNRRTAQALRKNQTKEENHFGMFGEISQVFMKPSIIM